MWCWFHPEFFLIKSHFWLVTLTFFYCWHPFNRNCWGFNLHFRRANPRSLVKSSSNQHFPGSRRFFPTKSHIFLLLKWMNHDVFPHGNLVTSWENVSSEVVPGGDLAKVMRACCMISNSTVAGCRFREFPWEKMGTETHHSNIIMVNRSK